MRGIYRLLFLFPLLLFAETGHARLEVCNRTDLVLLVAVGYDTPGQQIAAEGWWRIYPGFCEVPVDVAMVKGDYYMHAESNPRSTMPDDAFTWGDEQPLCVALTDFRHPDAGVCQEGQVFINFDRVDKNWRNLNRIEIEHEQRKYKDIFAAKVAGTQRLLSILGHEIGDIDGVIGRKTVAALHQIGVANNAFGLDFKRIYPILEEMIAKQHKLDN